MGNGGNLARLGHKLVDELVAAHPVGRALLRGVAADVIAFASRDALRVSKLTDPDLSLALRVVALRFEELAAKLRNQYRA